MDVTLERIYKEALALSDDAKTQLAERLVEHLEANMPSELRREHLAIVQRRRGEILSGRVNPVDGPEALEQARRMLRK